MKFMTGLCQDDVATSSSDVTSRNKSCLAENFGKSHRRNLRNLLLFGSYAAKSWPGGEFTPPLGSMCVKSQSGSHPSQRIWEPVFGPPLGTS